MRIQNMSGNPWTCIVLTSSHVSWSRVLVEAVKRILNQNADFSASDTAVLSAVDPEINMGSGAATLNALFVATEYLSAKRNFTAITADVLQNVNILILHHGRDYVFDICGKALISLPPSSADHLGSETMSEVESNLQHLLTTISSLQSKAASGVWVCSTDASFILEDHELKVSHCSLQDCTIFCTYSDLHYASYHGIVLTDDSGSVENITYCPTEEYLAGVAKDDKVLVISGLVYFPFIIVEKLLSFYSIAPLNSSTYVGIDGGGEPLRMSLFFDILVAMIKGISLEDYSSGKYGYKYDIKAGLNRDKESIIYSARKIIWSCLSKYELKSVTLENLKHCYWDERRSARNHINSLLQFGKTGLLQSSVEAEKFHIQPRSTLINSYVHGEEVSVGNNSLICNSDISGGNVSIGHNCLVAGLHINIPKSDSIMFLDNLAFLSFGKTLAVLGIDDELYQTVDLETCMFFGIPAQECLKLTGLTREDVWFDKPNNLWHAKLFPETCDVNFYFQVYSGDYNTLMKMNWKAIHRLSICELIQAVNVEAEIKDRQSLKSKIICKHIEDSIRDNTDTSFLPIFKVAFSEGWHSKILDTLDKAAEKCEGKHFELCRTLSCIADMLGTMAGIMGRLRSGPGNNKAWITAFDYIRSGEPGKALIALKDTREQWLHSNLIIRAARHYESTLQIIIQNAVKSAKLFIHLKSCSLPPIGEWVTAECPARVDLQGGWSDTPPICYEQGGSVVNIAVLIDGEKPIGARVRRTKPLSIRLVSDTKDFKHELEIKCLNDLADYNQPYANGALLKAAVVCSEIVSLNSDEDLLEQLKKYEGGLELHAWSNLPQGSGLGTSSILAGCILAALWTAAGRTYSKVCILHAVLYLEQLLTTGGGWQDQVGGIMGGVNRGYSTPSLPLEIKVKPIPISEHFLNILNKHLFLIYTGKVRLAKNLLQNVIRNWYAREPKIVSCFKQLVDNSVATEKAFAEEDLKGIGDQMNTYWEQKKILAPGCEPTSVQQLMKQINCHTLGQLLVGAGGGGFMCILTREPQTVDQIRELVLQLPFSETMSVHSVGLDVEGLAVKIEGQKILVCKEIT